MKSKSVILLFLVGLASIGMLRAQEGVDLSLEKGKISGLPKKYFPASFDAEGLSLSIGGKKIIFPKTLQHILRYNPDGNPFGDKESSKKIRPCEYRFWALLKRDSKLSPYIVITIIPKGGISEYVELTIGLDDLKFISAVICTSDWGRIPIALGK